MLATNLASLCVHNSTQDSFQEHVNPVNQNHARVAAHVCNLSTCEESKKDYHKFQTSQHYKMIPFRKQN